jgi:GTP-binding protein YchF
MSQLECGIVGLPNVGKSTLFNALTKAGAASSNYPFCTIDPNVGVVDVYDPRLERLSVLSNSQKIIYASMRFVDIAGLVKGASQGEGLGNQFLSHIRQTDAIVHVVRCFDEDDIIHVSGKVDPIADIETINLELALADMQSAQNTLQKLEKQAKNNKEMAEVVTLLKRVLAHLEQGLAVRSLGLTADEQEKLKPYPFLTAKKVLYAANVSENDLPEMDNKYVQVVREFAKKEGSLVVPICARIESEIAELDPSEQKEFLDSLGLKETGLNRLIHASFDMLGLITYLTTGDIETRAWTINKGMTAVEAAGKIHSDIQRGFIRAEVVSYEDMIHYNGRNGAREAGKLRAEGRDYIVKDGDVMLFLHA